MTHRFIGFATAAALLALTAAAKDAAAQNIPVAVGANASSLVGVDFELPIEIDMSARAEQLGSFALRLSWNPAVLQLVGGKGGDFGDLTINSDSIPFGVFRTSGINAGGMGGKFTAAVLRLRPMFADTTTIQVTVQEFFAAQTFTDLTAFAAPVNGNYCQARGRYGDINADGASNSTDALIALTGSVGLPIGPYDITLGDVTGDGVTQASDALLMLSNAVGLDVTGFRVYFVAPGLCATSEVIAGFSVSPVAVSVMPGSQVQYSASATDSVTGVTVAVSDVFWIVSDPTKATITPDGLLLPSDTGLITVSAVRAGTSDSAATTLSIISSRPVHWVDAAAALSVNQLGTLLYPYSSIQAAVNAAAPGDTVKVLPGRYQGNIDVSRRTIIVGDTTGGVWPVIASGPWGVGFQVNNGADFWLQNFDLDTTSMAVSIQTADTVVLQNLRHKATQWGGAVTVDSANYLRIAATRFLGAGPWSYDAAVSGRRIGVVSIDSTTIAAFGYGLDFESADSVEITNSRFLGISWSAVSICPSCKGDTTATVALVASNNRFDASDGAAIELNRYRSVALDHNVLEGGSSYLSLISLAGGAGAGVVKMLGDSVRMLDGTWLDVTGSDTIMVDSVSVMGASATLTQGRYVQITNTNFDVIPNGGVYAAFPADSGIIVLANVNLLGDRGGSCRYCSWYAFETDAFRVDASNVSVSGTPAAFQIWNGAMGIVGATFANNDLDIGADCSSLDVQLVASVGSSQSIQTNGCAAEPVVVNLSSFRDNTGSISTSYNPTTITNDTIVNSQNGIDVWNESLTATGNVITNPTYVALDLWGAAGVAAVVSNNIVTCGVDGASWVTGLNFNNSQVQANTNNISGCYAGINVLNTLGGFDLPAPVSVEVRGNAVSMPTGGYSGIEVSGDAALSTIAQNSVTGPTEYGSIWAHGSLSMPLANVDTNTISNSTGVGILAELVDSLRVRGNNVTNNTTATCCVFMPNAAIVVGASATTNTIAQVRLNRVTTTQTSGIVIARSFGDPVTVQVDSNTVKTADSAGVWIADYTVARVKYNAVDGALWHGVVNSQIAGVTPAVIDSNNFTNSGGYGVNNQSSFVINAGNNWWNDVVGPSGFYGEASGTSLGDSVSINVTWAPALTAPAAAPIPMPPPPAPVVSADLGILRSAVQAATTTVRPSSAEYPAFTSNTQLRFPSHGELAVPDELSQEAVRWIRERRAASEQLQVLRQLQWATFLNNVRSVQEAREQRRAATAARTPEVKR